MGSLFFCFLLFCCTSLGQQRKAVSEQKFRINLPGYWKAGNKAWQILPDHLVEICPELEGKELCGDDCNPKYTVEFYMSEPTVANYRANIISTGAYWKSYNFVTTYSFECALLLFDDKDKLITKIIVVDAGEYFTVTHRAELATQPIGYNLRQATAGYASRFGTANNYREPYFAEQSPFTYINENTDKLYPTQLNMLHVVDQKFRDL